MYIPKSIYSKLALQTILNHLKGEPIEVLIEDDNSLNENKSCFVTLHKKNGDLRGCIGTILPVRENLYEEIKANAISAAIQDPRFEPLNVDEIENITISVDVLSKPKLVKDIEELDEKKYGIIVSKGFQKGVLLPNLDGVNSVEEQVRIAKLKGGIYESDNGKIKIEKFTAKRYF